MKYKPIIKIAILSALTPLLVAVISNWKINYNSVIIFIAYFCLTIYCIKKYGKELRIWVIFAALCIGRFPFEIKVIYGYFTGELWSLPYYILYLLGIICGFLYLRLKHPLNVLPFLFCGCFAAFMFFQGWDYWICKANFGTFTGKVTAYNLPANFQAFNEKGDSISDKDFVNKVVLLDFWHTRCGICFEKFPQVESVHDKYKTDSSVVILAVNKPVDEDKPNQAFEIIKEKGYNFAVVIPKEDDLAEKFGVKNYPTTFVINQNGQIVFKGDIKGAVEMINELKSNSR